MNLALNAVGDIELSGRNMRRVAGTEYTAQTAKTNLFLQEGEWIVDRTEGVPWLTGAIEKGVPLPLIAQLVRAVLSRTVGVLSIDSLDYSFNSSTRTLEISFSGTTIYGKTFVGVVN